MFLCSIILCLSNFYLYLQKCILQISDGSCKLPASVITSVNEIDRLPKLNVKILHWLRNYELFRRFVDADSENNLSLLLNVSRDFSSFRAFGRLFQTFAPVNAKLFLK